MCLCLSFSPFSFRVVFADSINAVKLFFLLFSSALLDGQMLCSFVAGEDTRRKTLLTGTRIVFNGVAAFM